MNTTKNTNNVPGADDKSVDDNPAAEARPTTSSDPDPVEPSPAEQVAAKLGDFA